MEYNNVVAEKIKNLRLSKNLTQKQLAEKLQISDKAISKWERGLSCPDISLLVLLANTLGVTVDELLSEKSHISYEPAEISDTLADVTLETNKRRPLFILSIIGISLLALLLTGLGIRALFHQDTQEFRILTSSMSPAINQGDMITIKKVRFDEIRINDIISYHMAGDVMITHRVVDITEEDGVKKLILKGDNNAFPDEKKVTNNQVIGRVIKIRRK